MPDQPTDEERDEALHEQLQEDMEEDHAAEEDERRATEEDDTRSDWPDVEDVDDLPIAAQFDVALAALTSQFDEASARIDQLYRTGIKEIRELTSQR